MSRRFYDPKNPPDVVICEHRCLCHRHDLDRSATYAAAQHYPLDMPFIYRCPDLGVLVQSYASAKTSDGAYEVLRWRL